MDKILNISYNPNIVYIYPLIKIMRELPEDKNLFTTKWQQSGLGQLAIDISTKLRMLVQVTNRIDKKLVTLEKIIKTNIEVVKEAIKKDKAYKINEEYFPFELLIDLETFIFSTRSTYEIMGKFISAFYTEILKKSIDQKEIIKTLDSNGIDIKWIKLIQESRILFFHNKAPWIALKINEGFPNNYEIIILKEDIKDLSDSTKYITFKELKDTYWDFSESLNKIQELLVHEIFSR